MLIRSYSSLSGRIHPRRTSQKNFSKLSAPRKMAVIFCEFISLCQLARFNLTVVSDSVGEACNLSEKNDLIFLESSSGIDTLLRVFSSGTHRCVAQRLEPIYNTDLYLQIFRVLVRDASGGITGSISDRHLVTWFAEHVRPRLSYSCVQT